MLQKKKENTQTIKAENKSEDIPHNVYVNQSVYTPHYFLQFKSFCVKCLNSLAVEKGFHQIKSDSLTSIVYSSASDVLYIYLEDKYTADMLMETLTHWFIHTDPLFKGSTMDKDTQGTYIIEINYMDESIIQKNKENNLKNIRV